MRKNNKIYSNLSDSQSNALNQLVKDQKEGKFIFQRCDKGGALAMMNRSDYIESVNREHLNDKVTLTDGTVIRKYRRLDECMLGVHHEEIKKAAKNALEEGIITKDVAENMTTPEPRPGRAYGMPKCHKPVKEGHNLPPLRLVISGCGSTTENCSHFVNHFCKDIPPKLESYLQDTPDFLRKIEEMNSSQTQPLEAFPVTIDAEQLYPSIPQDEGVQAFQEIISDPKFRDQSMPWQFLILLLKFVLQFNAFLFNDVLYLQEYGTAIGTKLAPVYANIYMSWLEKRILNAWKGRPPDLWRRFIDDVFSIWSGTEAELLDFLRFINTFHHSIKFTAEYRINNEKITTKWKDGDLHITRVPLGNLRARSVDFLDTTVWINDRGKFESDLFVKDTDRITYLMPQSCHPQHITDNIPYSLGFRLKRICSSEENFKLRLNELSNNLKTRGYSSKVIKNAFNRLTNISREQALQKSVNSKDNNRMVLAITYDPRLVSPSATMRKHYEIATKDPNFHTNFPKIPRIGFKRAKNIGEILIRAKLYPVDEQYSLRNRNGFMRCTTKSYGCELCVHSQNAKEHKSCHSGEKYPIKEKIRCSDTYIIYSIQCKQCPKIEYIGQTTNSAKERFYGHHSDVLNKRINKPVPKHFCDGRHKVSDMLFIPFEKLRKKDQTLLDLREKFWINKKNTAKTGLNIRY